MKAPLRKEFEMAYEDNWTDDPMSGFSDDLDYYDEERGFYDDFQERLNEPDDAELDAEAMAADEPAEPATSVTGTPNVDRDFHETLHTDDVVADQIEDPALHEAAKEDYEEIDEAI
jgi:DNA replication initiation complex subunit (GINS family)